MNGFRQRAQPDRRAVEGPVRRFGEVGGAPAGGDLLAVLQPRGRVGGN